MSTFSTVLQRILSHWNINKIPKIRYLKERISHKCFSDVRIVILLYAHISRYVNVYFLCILFSFSIIFCKNLYHKIISKLSSQSESQLLVMVILILQDQHLDVFWLCYAVMAVTAIVFNRPSCVDGFYDLSDGH